MFSQQRPPLLRLPNELLTEIVSSLLHPEDMLSLALVNKRLHRFLADSSGSFMWKRVRSKFVLVKTAVLVENEHLAAQRAACHSSQEISIPHLNKKVLICFLGDGFAAIPEPPLGQSEFDLAQLLFAKHKCYACREPVDSAPWSISLRIWSCIICWEKVNREMISKCLTKSEALGPDYLPPSLNDANPPFLETLWESVPKVDVRRYYAVEYYNFERVYKLEWEKLISEYNEVNRRKQKSKLKNYLEGELVKRAPMAKAVKQWIVSLLTWSNSYERHKEAIKRCHILTVENFALAYGLVLNDMKKSGAYRHIEAVVAKGREIDVSSTLQEAMESIVAETRRIQSNRIHSTTTRAQQTRRMEIERFYQGISSQDTIKPTLDTFRSIPILQALQKGVSPAGTIPNTSASIYATRLAGQTESIRMELDSSTVKGLIKVGLEQWKSKAKEGARTLLGYRGSKKKSTSGRRRRRQKAARKDTKSAENPVVDVDSDDDVAEGLLAGEEDLHMGGAAVHPDHVQQPTTWHSVPYKLDPELRVTSWFVCKRCPSLDPVYKRSRVMDFRGICSHECGRKDWKKSHKKTWSIESFALAPKAIVTSQRMLEILGRDEEDPSTTTKCFEGWWTCNHCTDSMNALEWMDLLRHCQRHETPDISLLSEKEIASGQRKLGHHDHPRSFAELLSGKFPDEERRKQLACVHCRPASSTHPKGHFATSKKAREVKVMDIHGIRQHMKEKHHVEDCRNEDFYYVAKELVKPSAGRAKATAPVELLPFKPLFLETDSENEPPTVHMRD